MRRNLKEAGGAGGGYYGGTANTSTGQCQDADDRTPSFMVSPSKNICKCFACGEGGTPVHFIMKHEQLSYPDALRYLAKKYHIEIKERGFRDDIIKRFQLGRQRGDRVLMVSPHN